MRPPHFMRGERLAIPRLDCGKANADAVQQLMRNRVIPSVLPPRLCTPQVKMFDAVLKVEPVGGARPSCILRYIGGCDQLDQLFHTKVKLPRNTNLRNRHHRIRKKAVDRFLRNTIATDFSRSTG